jgi:hypothetical protein
MNGDHPSSVAELLVNTPKNARLTVRYEPRHHSIAIEGTPEGFQHLAHILIAQASGEGNASSSCSSKIDNMTSLLNRPGKADSLSIGLHCHDNDTIGDQR